MEPFELQHHIDDAIKDPNAKVTLAGMEFTMGQLHELVPAKEKKFNLFLEWDDMCCYTAFGLYDILSSATKPYKTLELKPFYQRENYPAGIDYVKYECFKDKDPKEIDEIYESEYPEVLRRSPLTSFFNSISLMKLLFSSVTIGFPFQRAELSQFCDDISEAKFLGSVPVTPIVLPRKEGERLSFWKKMKYDIYVVADMGTLYTNLILNKQKDRSILSYSYHNNMDPYFMALYAEEFMKVGRTLNSITIQFLEEIPDDEEDEKQDGIPLSEEAMI